MNPAKPEIKFTYEDCLLLPEGKQYELIDGDLYMIPAPRPYHQIVSGRIYSALLQFVDEHKLGMVIPAPCDVYFSQHDVVEPDILFITADRLGIIKENYIQGAPDLLVEVVSPSGQERDRTVKRKLYALYGVREYWIVDPDAKSIELLTRHEGDLRTARTFVGNESLTSPLLSGFQLSLAEVFKPLTPNYA
ncbi:MAG TPA: Uma2 family endonuclease [Acidobacteriota bacterium]|jgi:Uma2 family endonuclease|nr:Uma2 family endonuclease [Acidobacteriota bacterium]